MVARNKSMMPLTALLTELRFSFFVLLAAILTLTLLLLSTPTHAQGVDRMGTACSDTECKVGIKSFKGPPQGPAFGLPAFTASWYSNEAGGKVCRGAGGDKCKNCDSINAENQCYNKGPYYYWCPGSE